MVVTGIFIVLTGVVLANNTRFGSTIVLQNLAHDIALNIREAQVYGIAVRRFGSDEFEVAYGMYFQQSAPSSYVLFADVDNNGVFDPGETVRETTVSGGYRIATGGLCVQEAGTSVDVCGQPTLSVTFRRPEPDACINGTFDDEDCLSQYDRARITVAANNGDTKNIIVENSGQISVQ